MFFPVEVTDLFIYFYIYFGPLILTGEVRSDLKRLLLTSLHRVLSPYIRIIYSQEQLCNVVVVVSFFKVDG